MELCLGLNQIVFIYSILKSHAQINLKNTVIALVLRNADSALKYARIMCAKVVLPPIRRRRSRPAEPSPVHASPGPTLLDLPFALSRTCTLFAVALFDCVCVCVLVSQLVCVNALAIVVVATMRCVFLNYAKKK